MTRDLLIEKWNPTLIDKNESACWLNNEEDEFHRKGDQPAVIHSNGTMEWCKNGQLHRSGGKPAIIQANGKMFWFKNGEEYFPENR